MKKTTIICDGCGKTIPPAINGVYPRVNIALRAYLGQGPHPKDIIVNELCEPCYQTVREAISTVLEACKAVGKQELRDAD